MKKEDSTYPTKTNRRFGTCLFAECCAESIDGKYCAFHHKYLNDLIREDLVKTIKGPHSSMNSNEEKEKEILY